MMDSDGREDRIRSDYQSLMQGVKAPEQKKKRILRAAESGRAPSRSRGRWFSEIPSWGRVLYAAEALILAFLVLFAADAVTDGGLRRAVGIGRHRSATAKQPEAFTDFVRIDDETVLVYPERVSEEKRREADRAILELARMKKENPSAGSWTVGTPDGSVTLKEGEEEKRISVGFLSGEMLIELHDYPYDDAYMQVYVAVYQRLSRWYGNREYNYTGYKISARFLAEPYRSAALQAIRDIEDGKKYALYDDVVFLEDDLTYPNYYSYSYFQLDEDLLPDLLDEEGCGKVIVPACAGYPGTKTITYNHFFRIHTDHDTGTLVRKQAEP